MDFLLVLMELLSLGVTAETLQANIDWKLAFSLQQGQFAPKFQVEGVAPHKPFFSDMWYKNVGTSFRRFITNQAFDGRTDSILMACPHWHSMQHSKNYFSHSLAVGLLWFCHYH